jgi:formate dehydrogenase subunit gamma
VSAAAQPANTKAKCAQTPAIPSDVLAHATTPLPLEILRFKKCERQLHWAIAVPFIICYATAVVLVVVYNPAPTRAFRAVFSWTHRLSGACLFLLPLWTVLRHRHEFDVHFHNVRTAWRWTLEDVKWLFLTGLSIVNKRVVLPDQDKFNAGEKLNFMFLTASYPLFLVTGFLIWLPGVAFASWILHLSLAALATPLIVGHIFMATVNPDTRVGLQGMISGYVNRRWAQHHYRLWYNERFGHLHRPPAPDVKPVHKPSLVIVPALAPPAPARAVAVVLVSDGQEPLVHEMNQANVSSFKHKPEKDLSEIYWPPAKPSSPASQVVAETE